jgi:protein transport protein SEC31
MGDKEKRVYEALSSEFARVKQANPHAAGTVKKVIEDTERRLNVLYDELNNGRIPDNTTDRISQINEAIKSGDAGSAMHMHTDLLTSATTEVAHWAPGIKQLIRLGLTQG